MNLLIEIVVVALIGALGGVFLSVQSKRNRIRNSLLRQHDERPLVVAHRGGSGYRPEHSLAGYDFAIDHGADYIELDLVSTSDHVLMVLHDRELDKATSVETMGWEPSLGYKMERESPDEEVPITTYWVNNFTSSQIKNLKIRQRYATRNQGFNDLYSVKTFEEVLKFARGKEQEIGKSVPLYIELKDPTFHRVANIPLEEPFLKTLVDFEYFLPHPDPKSPRDYIMNPNKKLIIQCFEPTTLKFFHERVEGVVNVLLIKENLNFILEDEPSRTYFDLIADEGLKEAATYAQGIGPHKMLIIRYENNQKIHTDLVTRAHQAGLAVHAYTFGDDKPRFDPAWGIKSPQEQYFDFFEAGIDGLFTDHCISALEAAHDFIQDTYPEDNAIVLESPVFGIILTSSFSAFIFGIIFIMFIVHFLNKFVQSASSHKPSFMNIQNVPIRVEN